MTLPSNSSMKVFPDNTLTTYKTLLPEYVTATTPLECALHKITCPTTWYNVLKENIILIEGTNSEGKTPILSTKRLQQTLTKSSHTFFPHVISGEPTLSRTSSSNLDTLLKDCLEKGVEISRTQDDKDSTEGNGIASSEVGVRSYSEPNGAPSGGFNANSNPAFTEVVPLPETSEATPQDKAEKVDEIEEVEDEKEGLLNVGGYKVLVRDSRDILPAVAAVRKLLAIQYTEVGVVIGSSGKQLTQQELTGVKATLKLKALDKLVTTFKFPSERRYTVFSLQGAFLQSNLDLIHYLNKHFNNKNPHVVKKLREHYNNNKSTVFTYNRYTMKSVVALPPNVILQLPVKLAIQLGFGPGVFLTGKTESRAVVDLMFRAQTVYVYSDIVKHSIVGDRRAPLLRVVNVNPLLGDTQTLNFQPPIYQPVSKTSFRQITLYLRDSTGQPIPFEPGAVTVVLAFRPVNSLQH